MNYKITNGLDICSTTLKEILKGEFLQNNSLGYPKNHNFGDIFPLHHHPITFRPMN